MRDDRELSADIRDLMSRQRELLACYESLLGKVWAPKLQKDLTQLCRTKSRHLQLTERLMEIIES